MKGGMKGCWIMQVHVMTNMRWLYRQTRILLNMLVPDNDSFWLLHYCSRASFPILPCPTRYSLECLLQWNDVNGHDTNHMQTCNLPQHNLGLKFTPLTDPQQWVPSTKHHRTPLIQSGTCSHREKRGQSHWQVHRQQRSISDREKVRGLLWASQSRSWIIFIICFQFQGTN